MKKTSIFLIIIGVIITISLIIYYKSVVNPVDSDSMTMVPDGHMVSKWPIFIGIICTFVGCVFFYVAQSEKKAE